VATLYTTNATSGYNTPPHSEDVARLRPNQYRWATILKKLTDPIKTAVDAIDAALVDWAANGLLIEGASSPSVTVTDTTTPVTTFLQSTEAGGAPGRVGTSTNHSFGLYTNDTERARLNATGLRVGTGDAESILHLDTATEELEVVDAGSTAATEQDWIEVQVGDVVGYIRVFATK